MIGRNKNKHKTTHAAGRCRCGLYTVFRTQFVALLGCTLSTWLRQCGEAVSIIHSAVVEGTHTN